MPLRLFGASAWLDQAEIEEAERRNSRSRFLRLWKGQWQAGGGDALDGEDIEKAIKTDGPMTGTEEGFEFVAGLDLSTRRDHSALCVLGIHRGSSRRIETGETVWDGWKWKPKYQTESIEPTREIRLARVISWKPLAGQIDLQQVRRDVLALHEQFRFRLIYDPHQAGLMVQDFQQDRIEVEEMTFSGANLSRMASELLQTFRDKRISLYRDEDLIRDLGKISIVEKSYGYKLEAVRDEHGHADRAIALAIVLPSAVEMANSVRCYSLEEWLPFAF